MTDKTDALLAELSAVATRAAVKGGTALICESLVREAIEALAEQPAGAVGEPLKWAFRHKLADGTLTDWIVVSDKPTWPAYETIPLYPGTPPAASVDMQGLQTIAERMRTWRAEPMGWVDTVSDSLQRLIDSAGGAVGEVVGFDLLHGDAIVSWVNDPPPAGTKLYTTPPAASVDVEGLRELSDDQDRHAARLPTESSRMLRYYTAKLRALIDSAGGAKGATEAVQALSRRHAEFSERLDAMPDTPQPDGGGGAVACPKCGAPCTTTEEGHIDSMSGDLRYTAYHYSRPPAASVTLTDEQREWLRYAVTHLPKTAARVLQGLIDSASEAKCDNCGKPKHAERALDACACASLTYTPQPDGGDGAGGEPFAWFLVGEDGKPAFSPYFKEADADAVIAEFANMRAAEREQFTKHKLYTRPSAAAAVPEGFVLVPREPTRAMEEAGVHAAVNKAQGNPWFPFAWEAALAAAPAAPKGGVVDEAWVVGVTGWTKADGKTLWMEHDGEPVFRSGKRGDLGPNRAIYMEAAIATQRWSVT